MARGRAADFEARHGGRSFLAWTQEHARPALMAGVEGRQGRQAVHQVAAAYDLDLKLRGAGLVVSHRSGGRLHIKASDVDRGLSIKALTDRLGPFEPPRAQVRDEPSSVRYERPAPSGELYEAFQREREASVRARDAAIADLSARHRAYGQELTAWYRRRLQQEHAQGLKGALRRDRFRHIAAEREKDRKARREREREERRRVRAAHPIPHWQGYLEAEAVKGNEAALASLRSRQRCKQRLEDAVLTAENADEARHIVHAHMRPAIRRDGRLIYRVTDGGVVSDEATHVRVPQPTTAAAFLALSLAADRFGSRPLTVNGTEEFCTQVAGVAGIEGVLVTFADPGLERLRVRSRTVSRQALRRGRAAPDIDQGR